MQAQWKILFVVGLIAIGSSSPASADQFLSASDLKGMGYAMDIDDMDGDGIEDLIVGLPKAHDGYILNGAARILFRDVAGNVIRTQHYSAATNVAFPPSPWNPGGAYSQFGRSVASIGDIDGDGNIDLAIGAPNDHPYGLVMILLLDDNQGVKDEVAISHGLNGFPAALVNSDRFGSALDAADMDGDGRKELVISAPSDGNGAVWIVHLHADGTVQAATKLAYTVSTYIDFGRSVAFTPDSDGNGLLDVAVGAPQDAGLGAVYHLSPDSSGAIVASNVVYQPVLQGSADLQINTQGGYGASLAYAGDVHAADGDLLVGATLTFIARLRNGTWETHAGVMFWDQGSFFSLDQFVGNVYLGRAVAAGESGLLAFGGQHNSFANKGFVWVPGGATDDEAVLLGEDMWPYGGDYVGSATDWRLMSGATLSVDDDGTDVDIDLGRLFPAGSYRLFVKNFYEGTLTATIGGTTHPLNVIRYDWTKAVTFVVDQPFSTVTLSYGKQVAPATAGNATQIVQGLYLTPYRDLWIKQDGVIFHADPTIDNPGLSLLGEDLWSIPGGVPYAGIEGDWVHMSGTDISLGATPTALDIPLAETLPAGTYRLYVKNLNALRLTAELDTTSTAMVVHPGDWTDGITVTIDAPTSTIRLIYEQDPADSFLNQVVQGVFITERLDVAPVRGGAIVPTAQDIDEPGYRWIGSDLFPFGYGQYDGNPDDCVSMDGVSMSVDQVGATLRIELDQALGLGSYRLAVKNFHDGTLTATLGGTTAAVPVTRQDWSVFVDITTVQAGADELVLHYTPPTGVTSSSQIVQGVFLTSRTDLDITCEGQLISAP